MREIWRMTCDAAPQASPRRTRRRRGGCGIGASVLDIDSEGSRPRAHAGRAGLTVRPGCARALTGRLGARHPAPHTVWLVTPADLTYAVVTPARNERENLERLAESVLGQTLPPTFWMIVDDASDDGMEVVAASLAARHPCIHVLSTAAGSDRLEAGRRQGRDLEAFRMGLRHLPEPVDVFVKVDADTSFDADYFARLMAFFAQQPDLGIGGGSCWGDATGAGGGSKANPPNPPGPPAPNAWGRLADALAL